MRAAAATMRGLGVRSPGEEPHGGIAAANKGAVPGADEMDMTLRDATRPHMWMVSLCPMMSSCGAANTVTRNSALKKGQDVMS